MSRQLRIAFCVVASVLVVLACGESTPIWACPMCKAALEEDSLKPMAYQASILFMLSVPMLIFGTLALVMVMINRRESAALQGTELFGRG